MTDDIEDDGDLKGPDPSENTQNTEGIERDGAPETEPADAGETTENGYRREPKVEKKDDKPEPFDRSKEITDLASELSDDESEPVEDGDTKPADEAKAADDEKADTKTPGDESAEKPADEKPKDEAKKPDPHELTDAEIAALPKKAQSGYRRLQKRYREIRGDADFGKAMTDFAKTNKLHPSVFSQGLSFVAEVINAKDNESAALRLADEMSSIMEDKEAAKLTNDDRARVLRKLADKLAPPPPPPKQEAAPAKLDEDLGELVEAKVLSRSAALAEMEHRHPREKAPAPAEPAPQQRAPGADAAMQAAQQAAVETAKHEVARLDADLKARHGEQWDKVRAKVIDTLRKDYPNAAPHLWGKIVRAEAQLALQAIAPKKKATPPPTISSRGGGRQTASNLDELDKIMAED